MHSQNGIKCSGSRCRHAVGDKCQCACLHANHGTDRLLWAAAAALSAESPAKFDWIADDDVADYRRAGEQRSLAAETTWQDNVLTKATRTKDGRQRPFTHVIGKAGARLITDNKMIDWLARHPSELEQVKWLSDQIADLTASELSRTLTGAQRYRAADHLWCDILAAAVCVIEGVQHAISELKSRIVDGLADMVWNYFRQSRDQDCGNGPAPRKPRLNTRRELDTDQHISDALLKKLIKMFLERLCDIVIGEPDLTLLLFKLRVLALVLCPDCVAHKVVWDHCYVPLFKAFVSDEVKEVVHNFYPALAEPATWTI